MRRAVNNMFLVFITCVIVIPGIAIAMEYLTKDTALWTYDLFYPWLALGVVLGVAHLVLRPILRFVTAPLGCLTMGFSGWVIDIGLIYAAAYLVVDLEVPSLLYALACAGTINLINMLTLEKK